MTQAEHQVLLNRIPSLPDLQSAWSLLLHCASARANYFLRVVPPELGEEFARAHDSSLWACLCTMMGISEVDCEGTAREAASLPLALGGLGLRSASRTHPSAYWASWADSLHMVQKRHPGVAGHLLTHLEGVPMGQSLTSATTAARSLDGVHGFEVPSWRSLAAGARPPLRDPEDHEPGCPRQGWQHEASSRVEQDFRALDLFPRLSDTQKTMLRSQSGPGAGAFLSTTPSNPLTRIDSFLQNFAADFAFPFPCRRASAGVAAPSIPMATTVQHVLVLGLWLVGDSQWRVRSPVSVGKVAAVLPRTG